MALGIHDEKGNRADFIAAARSRKDAINVTTRELSAEIVLIIWLSLISLNAMLLCQR